MKEWINFCLLDTVSVPVRYIFTLDNGKSLLSIRQHGGTPFVVEYRSGESESKSESPTREFDSKSPKNGTRVGLESESRVRVVQLCRKQQINTGTNQLPRAAHLKELSLDLYVNMMQSECHKMEHIEHIQPIPGWSIGQFQGHAGYMH